MAKYELPKKFVLLRKILYLLEILDLLNDDVELDSGEYPEDAIYINSNIKDTFTRIDRDLYIKTKKPLLSKELM